MDFLQIAFTVDLSQREAVFLNKLVQLIRPYLVDFYIMVLGYVVEGIIVTGLARCLFH